MLWHCSPSPSGLTGRVLFHQVKVQCSLMAILTLPWLTNVHLGWLAAWVSNTILVLRLSPTVYVPTNQSSHPVCDPDRYNPCVHLIDVCSKTLCDRYVWHDVSSEAIQPLPVPYSPEFLLPFSLFPCYSVQYQGRPIAFEPCVSWGL